MLEIFTTTIISFVVAFLTIPVVIQIAEKKKLFDVPDERKLHTHTIASLGGVGIFLGLVLSSLIGIKFQQNSEFQYFFAAIFIIFFIGLKDDIIVLSAFKKLVTQIIIAAIVIHLGGIKIESLYGIGSVWHINPMYGIPLTYVTIILIVNAFNLIDGIDGLAGSLGLMMSLLTGTYFFLAGFPAYSMLAFALAASLTAFLIFNYHPAKIFMGDSGSLLIGLLSSVFILKFINIASVAGAVLPMESAVAIGISILIVPLADTLRVFTIRIAKGRSPFSPDRNHVHHLLIDRGLSHSTVTFTCVIANLAIIIFTYLNRSLGNITLISIIFGSAFLVMGILYLTLPKRKLVMQRQIVANLQKKKPASKVINLDTTTKIAPAEQVKG